MLRRSEPGRQSARRGVSAVESGIVLLVFLTMVMGTIELGIGVFRWHTIAEAARIGARTAIVHGSLANSPWSASARGRSGIQSVIQPLLTAAGFQSTPAITVTYVNGTNTPGSLVKVTVSSTYKSSLASVLPGGSVNLSATSTMAITH